MILTAKRRLALGGVLFLLATQGCGNPVRAHGKAAITARASLDLFASGLETACDPATVAQRDDARERARRCLDVARAHDLARVAWDGWAGGILLALDDELNAGALLPLALRLVPYWPTLMEAAEWWGIDLPPLPPLLTGGAE